MLVAFMRGINGSGTFQANDPHIELLRAVAVCHPGWSGLSRITFVPDSDSSPPWLPWKDRVLLPVLLPAMEEARFACAAGDCRTFAVCDNALDSALAPDMREASRAAGAALMAGYSAPKFEKLWLRYRALLNSGEVPGHLAIVCTLRGTAFHLAPAAIVGAYLLIEAKGGLPLDGITLWANIVGECLTRWHGLKDSNLRAA